MPKNGEEGIAIGFFIGANSVGPVDVRDSFTDKVLDEVIDMRILENRLLNSVNPDGTIEGFVTKKGGGLR